MLLAPPDLGERGFSGRVRDVAAVPERRRRPVPTELYPAIVQSLLLLATAIGIISVIREDRRNARVKAA